MVKVSGLIFLLILIFCPARMGGHRWWGGCVGVGGWVGYKKLVTFKCRFLHWDLCRTLKTGRAAKMLFSVIHRLKKLYDFSFCNDLIHGKEII